MATKKVFALVCAHCQHGFTRMLPTATKNKRTSCPICTEKFSIAESIVTGESADLLHKERVAKKRRHNELLITMGKLREPQDSIRAAQVPLSAAEAVFKKRASDKRWKVHRPSWPDFLVETPEGLIAVEVKSSNDAVSPTQFQTFNLLEKSGVKVYIWRNSKTASGTLAKWEQGLALTKVGLK